MTQHVSVDPDCQEHQQNLGELVILGVTHKSAETMDTLSSLVIPEEEQPEALAELKELLGADELVYISTCNRSSFIIISDRKPDVLQKITANWFIANRGGTDVPEAESWIKLNGKVALDHLLLVASSLDPMVVGERQILGQFKQSFINARKLKLCGAKLNFLYEQILKVAKRVYGTTSVSQGRLSVVSLAEVHIAEFCQGEAEQTAVLVGAGKMTELMAEYLQRQSNVNLVFVNRTESRSQDLAERYHGTKISLNTFLDKPLAFDVLVTSTAAPHFLFDRHFLKQLTTQSPRLLIDLAVPADIDPKLREQEGVTLINMEELRKESKEHSEQRLESLQDAEEIIEEGARAILDRWKIRAINPAIGALRRKYEQESKDHLNKLFETRLKDVEDEVKETISDWATRMAKHWAIAHAAGIKQTARNCCMKAVMSYLDASGIERNQ